MGCVPLRLAVGPLRLAVGRPPHFKLRSSIYAHRHKGGQSEKSQFQSKSNVFSGQTDPLDCLKTITSGGLKQLSGTSLQIFQLHFQGEIPPAPPPRR